MQARGTPNALTPYALPSPHRRQDEKNIAQIQIKVPIQHAGLVEPSIESGMFGFQAKNDIGHGIDGTKHSFRADILDHESVTAQQSFQCIARKIVQMGWWMDLAPFASSDPGYDAAQVTCRERQQPAGRQNLRYFLNVKIRPAQMFNRIPHAYDIRRDLKPMN